MTKRRNMWVADIPADTFCSTCGVPLAASDYDEQVFGWDEPFWDIDGNSFCGHCLTERVTNFSFSRNFRRVIHFWRYFLHGRVGGGTIQK